MFRNPNHPALGSIVKVEPIRRWRDIKKIRRALRNQPRNLALFNLGINTNLRGIDLINLRVGQVRYLKPGESLVLRETKTGKIRAVTLNPVCYRSIQALLDSPAMRNADSGDYLFQSQKGKTRLLPNTLNGLVKKWTREAGLKGNFGSHTLRKTFGYFHRVELGTDIPTLMRLFNHGTQRQTLDYLCIQADEIKNAYMKEI